jgi:Thiamine pyrophosphate enzyme, N-terminal TPP binding domain/Aldehyde dehydrogenase family
MSQTVAGTLIDVLEKIGVKQIFGLIGDSLNPIADAVRHSKIEWIGVRHEEGAALAAAGQAKLIGRLGVCCGTTGPGSNHLVAGLYEACREHAPVLAISGNMPRNLQGIDYMPATDPDLLFRDVSRYAETISSPAQAPSSIRPSPPPIWPRRRAFDAAAGRRQCEGGRERGALLCRLAEILRRDIEIFATLESMDTGIPIRETRMEVSTSALHIEYFAGFAGKIEGIY